MKRGPEVRDEHAKFVLPSLGVLGLYLGASAGAFLGGRGPEPDARLVLAGAVLGGLCGGAAALFAVQVWLWPVGRFASISGMLKAWLLAAPLAALVLKVLGEHEGAAAFLQNALFWLAGFASVAREERRR